MEINAWLAAAIADAERRGLPELKPLLEALAQATRALRAADFNDNHEYASNHTYASPTLRSGGDTTSKS